MDQTELCFLSAVELGRLIGEKQVSPVEVALAHLERIDATESTLNSFITRPGEEALEAARRAEDEIAGGEYRGVLHGVPVGLKDLYYVAGMRNTAGSRIFGDFVPDFDGASAASLKEAGAILMGKLNLHQFAFGPTGHNADYGDMHNPWDVERVAGGSSGGSGSAAAAGQCAITLGTDTGGSIRIPSALCGLAGLKPTYGRVSRYGLVSLSWSLDHPGPMARTVEDCAAALQVLAGYDPRDPASADEPVPDYMEALSEDLSGLRIGVPREYFEVPVDGEVERLVREALSTLEDLGAEVVEVSWPMYHRSADISKIILYAEAAAYHKELLLRRGEEYDPSVRWRFESGLFISGPDYLRALRHRRKYTESVRELFQQVDLLAGPMEPVVAPPIEADSILVNGERVGVIPALTQYTRPFNLTGYPALTVPCGFVEGLPVGLQLAAGPFEEATALRAGFAYQQATDWHKRRPPV